MSDYSRDLRCRCCGNHPVKLFSGKEFYVCVRCNITLPDWMIIKN